MLFKMPNGHDLRIECSHPDLDTEIDEELEYVTYTIHWNKAKMPLRCSNRVQAYAIAMGAQWAVKEWLGEN